MRLTRLLDQAYVQLMSVEDVENRRLPLCSTGSETGTQRACVGLKAHRDCVPPSLHLRHAIGACEHAEWYEEDKSMHCNLKQRSFGLRLSIQRACIGVFNIDANSKDVPADSWCPAGKSRLVSIVCSFAVPQEVFQSMPCVRFGVNYNSLVGDAACISRVTLQEFLLVLPPFISYQSACSALDLPKCCPGSLRERHPA